MVSGCPHLRMGRFPGSKAQQEGFPRRERDFRERKKKQTKKLRRLRGFRRRWLRLLLLRKGLHSLDTRAQYACSRNEGCDLRP